MLVATAQILDARSREELNLGSLLGPRKIWVYLRANHPLSQVRRDTVALQSMEGSWFIVLILQGVEDPLDPFGVGPHNAADPPLKQLDFVLW